MSDDSTSWWAPVPRSLRDNKEIGAMEIVVFVALVWRRNNDTQRCFPSIARIADDVGLGQSTVKRALNVLEKQGYITRTRRMDPAGKAYTSTEYWVRVDPAPQGEGLAHRGPRVSPQGATN